ncbi:MAG: thiopurine S-methyltransferase [Pseudomonadota bacterium]
MEHSFWHERWESGRIAFHEGAPNALMVKHFSAMKLSNARIFVPLAGKSVDMAWLASEGHEVIGAELDKIAVEAFFEEHGLTPEVTSVGMLTVYEAGQITLYQGDIFELSAETLGPVDAVFDRAALVALPPAMRTDYAKHLIEMTGTAPQFLITYEYSNPDMQGPPHSVTEDEVHAHYDGLYSVDVLERAEITGPLQNRTEGAEVVYRLAPR